MVSINKVTIPDKYLKCVVYRLTLNNSLGHESTGGQRERGHVSGEKCKARILFQINSRRANFLQAQGFDEYISEHLVSLNRSLPDRRDDWCKNNVLVDPAYLPSTSVSFVIDIDGDGDDDGDGVK